MHGMFSAGHYRSTEKGLNHFLLPENNTIPNLNLSEIFCITFLSILLLDHFQTIKKKIIKLNKNLNN